MHWRRRFLFACSKLLVKEICEVHCCCNDFASLVSIVPQLGGHDVPRCEKTTEPNLAPSPCHRRMRHRSPTHPPPSIGHGGARTLHSGRGKTPPVPMHACLSGWSRSGRFDLLAACTEPRHCEGCRCDVRRTTSCFCAVGIRRTGWYFAPLCYLYSAFQAPTTTLHATHGCGR